VEICLGAALLTPVVRNRLAGGRALGVLRGARHDVPADARHAQAEQRVADTGRYGGEQGRLMLGIGLGLLAEGDGDSDRDD